MVPLQRLSEPRPRYHPAFFSFFVFVFVSSYVCNFRCLLNKRVIGFAHKLGWRRAARGGGKGGREGWSLCGAHYAISAVVWDHIHVSGAVGEKDDNPHHVLSAFH